MEEGEIVSDGESIFDEPAEAPIEEEEMEEILINVRVETAENELKFSVNNSTTGKQLFDQVINTVGLCEIWYFGVLNFRFRIKYFPEDVDEIIPCFLRCRREMLAQYPEFVGFARYVARVWIGRLGKHGKWLKPRYEHSSRRSSLL
uniref:FERM N-terminal domain-containing protein n=1 Tax=Acrobeloides nanus TaxID=290746 RepID=A0A914DP15_9BILA